MKMRYAWASDVHLNCLVSSADVVKFANDLVKKDVDGVIITGDISTSGALKHHLELIELAVQRPVYFVLGNHDFWGSNIASVRRQMTELMNSSQFLRYLTATPYVALTKDTALIGHDGWYDGGNGNALTSRFMMVDWYMISDYVKHSGGKEYVNNGQLKDRKGVIELSQKLSREAIQHVQYGIRAAAQYHNNLIVCMHVPPFRESHIYRGYVGDSNAQPWFTSREMGEMLTEEACNHPNVHFTVLAGHTHGKFDGKIAHNLEVHVAEATYGSPALASLIEAK